MGHTKDLWTRPEKQPDDTIKRIPNARWGKGKRWLACWLDPDGNERTKAFTTKTPADKYWRDRESERDRGEYVDPKAGREHLDALASRFLGSVSVDATTKERYERSWRLQIKPAFPRRTVRSFTKPSEMKSFFAKLSEQYGESTVHLARHVLGGMFELAVADGDLKRNPVRNRIVRTGKPTVEKVTTWSDAMVWKLIDAHPVELRALPFTGATCGAREGELYALAVDDIAFDREIIHVRRQIKKVSNTWCFGLPKNDQEREVPLAGATAETLRVHMATYRPVLVTLPWEKPDGEPRTYRLIFAHPDSGEHLRHSTYDRYWKAALVEAGVLAPPVRKAKGQPKRYVLDSRKYGRHQLRHYYANMQLSGGTNIRELADYLGHHDPSFTLRVYGHLQPDSHERARRAVDAKFFRPRAVSDGS